MAKRIVYRIIDIGKADTFYGIDVEKNIILCTRQSDFGRSLVLWGSSREEQGELAGFYHGTVKILSGADVLGFGHGYPKDFCTFHLVKIRRATKAEMAIAHY